MMRPRGSRILLVDYINSGTALVNIECAAVR